MALAQTAASDRLAHGALVAAEACYDVGDFPHAEEAYREAARLSAADSPERYDAMLGLGLCLDHLARHDESTRIYGDVLAAPEAGEAHKNVARRNLAYAEGVRSFAAAEFEIARACFTKALSLHPADEEFRSDILLWVGSCHTQLGQFAAARETYADLLASTAHESVKSQASRWHGFAEGQIHFAARRYSEARSIFEELLGTGGPANEFRSGVMLALAHCYFHMSEYAQASRRYRYILQTRNASPAQKTEAREWRRAVPGLVERCWRSFGNRLRWGTR